jgi:NitT/TauT family transport system substrate-binding protein
MSVRRGIKALLALSLSLGIAACSNTSDTSSDTANSAETEEQTETIKVLVPSGAPALALLGAYDQENIDVEIVEGSDVLSAELAKSDSEYDVIVAPINLGVKVYETTQTYKLDSVLTWGNLYLVGTQDSQWSEPDTTIAAFGQSAVPGLVYNSLFAAQEDQTTWYPSVAEASQALLAKQEDMALLAMPAAAAAIAKGEENGLDLKIIADLQTLWQMEHDTDEKGYPQAAVFVKEEDEAKAQTLTSAVQAFLDEADTDSIEAKVDEVGAEKLGVPSAALAAKTWASQNIHYKKASQAKDDIASFLEVFNITLPDGCIVE